MNQSSLVTVQDQSQVGEARRAAAARAAAAGFDEVAAGRLAIVVSELATNLLKHAGGGALVVGAPVSGGVEVLSIDKGPGIANLAACLRDGYSSAGSSGTGLGAISRLATRFEVYSAAGTAQRGTIVMARLASGSQAAGERGAKPGAAALGGSRWLSGAINLAVKGETACGDGWAIAEHGGRCTAFICDGLGHGVPAAEAAKIGVEIFHKHLGRPAHEILAAVHDALRATRGAAAAIAEIQPARGEVEFCGLGNIVGAVVAPGVGSATTTRRMVSHNGTLGHGQFSSSARSFSYPWTADATLVMHSDGLMSRWDMAAYPGLAARHPALTAGILYRDFERGRDDVTVLAVRSASGRDAPGGA